MNSTLAPSIEGIELAQFGFVRVTGLTVSDNELPTRKVKPVVDMLGSWAKNNAYYIVVTERGQVWLAYGHEVFTDECEAEISRLCPKGGDQGMSTACAVIVTGSDQIRTHQLLSRFRDPSWEPAP